MCHALKSAHWPPCAIPVCSHPPPRTPQAFIELSTTLLKLFPGTPSRPSVFSRFTPFMNAQISTLISGLFSLDFQNPHGSETFPTYHSFRASVQLTNMDVSSRAQVSPFVPHPFLFLLERIKSRGSDLRQS